VTRQVGDKAAGILFYARALEDGQLPSSSAALFVDALCDPSTILVALEVLRCARVMGLHIAADVTATVEPLIDIDLGIRHDRRVGRLWSTALEIVGSTSQDHRGRALAAASALQPGDADDVTTQDGLDAAVTALSLHTMVGAPKWILAALGDHLDVAVAEQDALAAGVLLAHGAKLLRDMPRNRVDAWLEFISSMTPRSLPYGWLSASADPQTVVAYETAGVIARIALRDIGYEARKENTRPAPLNASTPFGPAAELQSVPLANDVV